MTRARQNAADDDALVGRAIDRAAVENLLEEGARLVSIVGPGGIGKTRLAQCFVRNERESGEGRTKFVDLTTIDTVATLCASIAASIGTRLPATGDQAALVAELGRALDRRGRILLVLDNFEALVASAAEAVAELLRAAPRARILVTTRIALDVPGEYRWPLQGLEVPPREIARMPIAELATIESVALFVRRARRARPTLTLGDDDVRAIAELTQRLDGIPLAIELAAGRISALAPAQIRDRLADHDHVDLLVRRRGEKRHESMRAVVESSLRLLDPHERACLVAFTIFEGGFTLAAADAVISAGSSLAALESLVAHSLLKRSDEPRFTFYEVVREVARAELDASDALRDATAGRHAEWFATRARADELVPTDLPNVIAAHADASRRGRSIDALDLAGAAAAIAMRRGLPAQALAILDETIARTPAEEPRGRSIARATLARGHAHAELGALDLALRDYETALAAEDAVTRSLAHVRLGTLVETRGDTATAREHFAAALACTKGLARGPLLGLHAAEAHAALGHAFRREGRLAEADVEIAASLAAYRAFGDDEGVSAMAYEAGVLALFHRRYDEARARFEEAITIARNVGAPHRGAAAITALGTLDQELGELDRARARHEEAIAIFRDTGLTYYEASTLYYLGGLHLERGRHDDASAVLASALALVRAVDVPRYEALVLGARAVLFAETDRAREAEDAIVLAEAAAARCPFEPALAATLAIHRLSIAAARDATTLAQARALADAHACDDARFALRLLTRARETAPTLFVRAGGRGFRLPGSTTDVDLARRAPLARILALLAERRVTHPGDAMRVDDLLAAGWPGERVRYEAGQNRVYVALAELRKLGLREWIVSDEAGYRLTTAWAVAVAAGGT